MRKPTPGEILATSANQTALLKFHEGTKMTLLSSLEGREREREADMTRSTLTFLLLFVYVFWTACQSLRNHLWGFVNGHRTNDRIGRGWSCEREVGANL